MSTVPSLSYNAFMSTSINAKENKFLKGVLARYKAENNVDEIKRYEEAIKYREEVIAPKFEKLAKQWAEIAGIPDSKFGKILTPQEIKYYDKDRAGSVNGFPEDLYS